MAVEVSQCELKAGYPRWSGVIPDWIGRRVLSAVGLVVLSVYLVYGHHPKLVCNTIATISAAIFTRDLVSVPVPRNGAQKAILLYWLTHGVLLYFDGTFGKVFGYFLAKFLLLSMLLVSAMQKTGRSVLHKVSADKIAKRSAWITSNNNSASGFLTTIDSNSSSSAFQPRFSTVTETKNITTTTQDKTATRESKTKTICDLVYNDTKIEATTVDPSTTMEPSRFESSSQLGKAVQQRYGRSLNDVDDRLFTTPSEQIIFKWPCIEIATLLVTNAYSKPVMWALKTNVMHRLVAQPTCGVLPPDSTVQLRVGVIEKPPNNASKGDRLAIDYIFVDDGTVLFDRSFLHRTDIPHRRKKIAVSYVF